MVKRNQKNRQTPAVTSPPPLAEVTTAMDYQSICVPVNLNIVLHLMDLKPAAIGQTARYLGAGPINTYIYISVGCCLVPDFVNTAHFFQSMQQ